MRSRAEPHSDQARGSRIDRLALRIAKRSRTPIPPPPTAVDAHEHQSRRTVLAGALGASVLVMLPLRLANPATANADASCAARCLDDANNAADQRLSKCFVSAFGTDFPDTKALAPYVAAKIRSGGLGALLLVNELAAFDRCAVVKELRYYYDTAQCAKPDCGDPKKYPPQPGCETCVDFCCFCPTGTVALGCLPNGDTSSCSRSCAACLESKAGGFPVNGQC
jgi:hypothetical protein